MQTKQVENGMEFLEYVKNGFGLSDYETVMQKVENGTTNKNFGNYEQVPILSSDNFGSIALRGFFEDNDYSYNDVEFLSVEEVEELLSEQDVIELNHDNTYNWNSPIERCLDFITVELIDSQEVIVFYAIHTGLDVRAGYTSRFAVKYSDNYASIEAFLHRESLPSVEFEKNNQVYNLRADIEAGSELCFIYIEDDNFDEIGDNYTQEEYLSTYDKNDYIASVDEFLSNEFDDYKKGSVRYA